MAAKAWRIAVIAGKGGVGKTTTVINLGAGLAKLGLRVLLVDCDPQGNLSSGLGLDPYAKRRTVADVIVGRSSAVDAILETEMPRLHLIPAHPDLSAVESELPARVNAEVRLRNAMREGIDGRYDVVLFDTPPNFGFHTISALGAARSAMVPLQMSAFALRGLKEVIRVIAAARRHLNPELELLGVVPTFVNNTRFSRDMLEALSEVSQVRVFRSEISLTVKLQESALQGVPVQVSAPSSRASHSYSALAAELVTVGAGRLPAIAVEKPAAEAPGEPVAHKPERQPEQEPEADEPMAEVEETDDVEAYAAEDDAEDTGMVDFEAGDDDAESDLDTGYAVTLAGEPAQGAVALSNGNGHRGMRPLQHQRPVRPHVMLELEVGDGAVAIAEMPSVGLHGTDEAEDDYAEHDAEAEYDDEAEHEHETEPVAERRRFWFFRRAKAS
jgi:chromosome partitioning protein